jgi:hypothetical protein
VCFMIPESHPNFISRLDACCWPKRTKADVDLKAREKRELLDFLHTDRRHGIGRARDKEGMESVGRDSLEHKMGDLVRWAGV